MAEIHRGDTVLEVSAGLGRSGIDLARNFGAHVTLTDIDTSRLEKASELVNKLGLSNQVTVKEADMFKIDSALGEDARYDVAMTEASLTHYPYSRKARFFRDISKHADKFLLHEVCFKTGDGALQDLTKKDMSRVLNIGFVPETIANWKQLLLDNGSTSIDYVATGELALLDPLSLIKDEGINGFGKIVCNAITQPYLRSRLFAAREAISSHSSELGYVTIIATKD